MVNVYAYVYCIYTMCFYLFIHLYSFAYADSGQGDTSGDGNSELLRELEQARVKNDEFCKGMCMYVCIYKYIHIRVYAYICGYTRHVCIHKYIHICVYAYIRGYMHI